MISISETLLSVIAHSIIGLCGGFLFLILSPHVLISRSQCRVMSKLRIDYVPIDKIRPYENNPRQNEDAIPLVKKSIEEFGFQVPLVLDKDLVVVTGHTRLAAAKELGMTELPCIIAKDLSPEKAKAFRLSDNKVAEAAGWDWSLLQMELDELSDFGFDMEDFGFIDYDAIDDMPVAPDDARAQAREDDDDEVEFVDDPGQDIPVRGTGRRTVTVFCDDEDQYTSLIDLLGAMGYRYK